MTINHLWAVRWPLPKQQRPNCTSSLRGGGCHPPCPNPAQPSWLPESVPCFSASCSNQIFTGTSLVYQAQRLFFHQASTQDSGQRWLKSDAHLAGAGSREWRWEKVSIAHHLGESKKALPTTLKGDLVLCSTGSVLCLPSISSGMERNSPKARRLCKASGQSFFSQSCWSHQFPLQLAGAWTQETSEGSSGLLRNGLTLGSCLSHNASPGEVPRQQQKQHLRTCRKCWLSGTTRDLRRAMNLYRLQVPWA